MCPIRYHYFINEQYLYCVQEIAINLIQICEMVG